MWLAVNLVARHLYLILIATLMTSMVMQKETVAEEISKKESTDIHNQADKSVSTAPINTQQALDAKQFNPHFLHTIPGQAPVDLSFFTYANQVLPGTYLADIYVNERYIEQIEIRFDNPVETNKQAGPVSAQACLNKGMLQRWGIDIMQFPAFHPIDDKDPRCLPLTEWIPHSQVRFNMAQQVLRVSIPQIAMLKKIQGEVSPKLWSAGVNAALLNYQILGRRYQANNSSNRKAIFSMDMALQGGINMGAWRLRYRANNSYDNGKSTWQILATHVARDIPDWRSRLTFGDGFTASDMFPGIRFRGIQLASDDAMLPNSLQGYAPSIHGIAQSQAKVTVKQNDYIVYTTFVAPGPFVLDDVLPNTSSGTLEITVTEADGRSTVSSQTYSAFPGQVREKSKRFYFAAGTYHAASNKARLNFMQGTLLYGVNAHITGYGGLLVSSSYRSVLGGARLNLKQYGASSMDITQTESQQEGTSTRGQALRWQYIKRYSPTATSFQIAMQHYLSSNFRTFEESANGNIFSNRRTNKRSHLESTLSQGLGKIGTFTASVEKIRHRHGHTDATVRFGYGRRIKEMTGQADYSHQKKNGILNRQLSLSLSFPLEWRGSSSSVSYSASSHFNRDVVHNATVSGLLLADGSLSYSLGLNASRQISQSSFASLHFRGPVAQIGMDHTQSSDYMVSSASLSGGVVLHQGGITLSQRLGDTVILARVPGAHNAMFENNMSVKTNTQGYAIIPYATPYRKNLLTLNAEHISDDIEIKNTVAEVVPTHGAVVLAEYEVRQGRKVLLTALVDGEQPVPFGSRVEDQRGREVGLVGPEGQVYLTGVGKDDILTVKWGAGSQDRCTLQYNPSKITTAEPSAPFSIETVACVTSVVKSHP